MTKTAKNILELAAKLKAKELESLIVDLSELARRRSRKPLSDDEIRAELDRRIAEMDRNPGRGIPLEEAMAQVRARLKKVKGAKAA